MLIEAVEKPFTYEWPDGRIRLEPGKPVNIADEHRALKVLAKCGERVRVIDVDWLSAWRELAQRTQGIENNDPRYSKIMQALDQCDRAFEGDSWSNFQKAAAVVKTIVEAQTRK